MSQGFVRKERLKGAKLITEVFKKGSSIKGYPLLAVYYRGDQADNAPLRVGFSVPKKKIRSAVKRNLLKRRIREAYRLHRGDAPPLGGALMFIYLPSEVLDYRKVEKGMRKILLKLSEAEAEGSQS